MLRFQSLFASLVLLVFFITACTPGMNTADIQPSPAKTDLPHPATEQSKRPGFVLFDSKAKQFQAYNVDGSQRFTAASPGMGYPDPSLLSVVDGAVYFSEDALNKHIFRTTPDGVVQMNIPVDHLSAFKVSADEQWIAWSTFAGDTNPATSQLWVAKLDGKGGVTDAEKIAEYNSNQSQAFWLVPLKWTLDGTLIFERSLSGLGGYYVYSSHHSLYGYDPTDGQVSTYVSAEDQNARMCVDGVRPDLDLVALNCNNDDNLASLRSLKDGKETIFPRLPEQNVVGTLELSPSGKWLAYAVARRNPDDEAGQVAVAPVDGSAQPQVIFKVGQNSSPLSRDG